MSKSPILWQGRFFRRGAFLHWQGYLFYFIFILFLFFFWGGDTKPWITTSFSWVHQVTVTNEKIEEDDTFAWLSSSALFLTNEWLSNLIYEEDEIKEMLTTYFGRFLSIVIAMFLVRGAQNQGTWLSVDVFGWTWHVKTTLSYPLHVAWRIH